MPFRNTHIALFSLLFLLTIFGCGEDMGPGDEQANPLQDVALSIVATGTGNTNARGSAVVNFGTCVCFWEFELAGSGSFFGDKALHELLTPTFPMFLLEMGHLDESVDGQPDGVVQSFTGPSPDETGSWPAVIAFNDGTNTWSAGDEDTPATLTVTINTTDHLEGYVSGICTAIVAGEPVLKNFTWIFSSAKLDPLGSPCD